MPGLSFASRRSRVEVSSTMELYRTYKLRLYPNQQQKQQLTETLNTCRWLYNSALQERRDAYRNWKEYGQYRGQEKPDRVNRFSQIKELAAIRPEIAELTSVYSHVLNAVLTKLEETYDAFFRRVKRGEKAGFPRFKGKNRYDSFTYPDQQEKDEPSRREAAQAGISGGKLKRNEVS